MGIGISVFLVAIGAILAFAVDGSIGADSGLDFSTVGVILMIVGGIGLATTVAIFGRRDPVATTTGPASVVEDEVYEDVTPRRTVRRRTTI